MLIPRQSCGPSSTKESDDGQREEVLELQGRGEGQESGEWVLVDLNDIVVHLMQPRVRDFYKLEDLWTVGADDDLAQTPD